MPAIHAVRKDGHDAKQRQIAVPRIVVEMVTEGQHGRQEAAALKCMKH